MFLKLFIPVKRSTCFGRSFRPSSRAQNCTDGNRHMSNSCCYLPLAAGTTNKMHLFLKLFILVKRSTCFGRSFRPSSGAQNWTYGNRHMSNSCCLMLWTSEPRLTLAMTMFITTKTRAPLTTVIMFLLLSGLLLKIFINENTNLMQQS